MRAVTAAAVVLSFLVVNATESSHTHGGGADSPAACSVCQLVHSPGSTIVSGTPSIAASSLLRAPALPGHRLNPRAIHLAPHQSRAPPLSISL